jgi:high-affinity iron transporter
MHQHTEINRWKTFVNDKIGNLVKNENYKGLALLSFIVVGREVFESVLFLSALGTQKHAVSNLHLYIIAGVIVALILVFVLSYIFINYTKNIPIRKLLQASSMVLGLLAVILIGKAIHSFQETGYIPIHSFFINIRVELLGIYPTIESILTQLILSILVVYLLFFHKPKSN